MDQNQNNTSSPLPIMPEVPQNNPQVFGPQQATNPDASNSTDAPQPTAQAMQSIPQAQAGSPVPMGGHMTPQGEFTSNPFLSFGKGLGSGLFYSPGTIIGAGALIMLLFIGISLMGGLLSGLLSAITPLLGFVVMLAVIIVGVIVAEMIFARTIIAFHKGGQSETVSFKETGALVSAGTGLALFGLAIVSGIIVGIGFILLIIPGLILFARLSLAPYALVVEKKSIFASLSRSWSLTKHHTWDMLGANIVQLIGGGSSMLLLPAVYAATANRYSELTTLEQQGATGKTKTHWSNYLVTILVFLAIGGYFLLVGFLVVSGVQTTQKATKIMNTVQSTPATDSLNSATSPTGQYCYYNGTINDTSAKYVCTNSKNVCLANEFCKTDNSYQLN